MSEKYRNEVKNKALRIVAVCAAVLALLVFSSRTDKAKTPELTNQSQRVEYLTALGLDVDAASETFHSVTLPDELGEVLGKYNEIQLRQGFDLSAYLGRECDCYTYELKSYKDESDVCYATIYIYNGAVIAGDVHSADANGFMCALRE